MKFFIKKYFFIISTISIPFLFLNSPKYLNLFDIEPCWPLLWLIPWSLMRGPYFGFTGGLCMGLVLDGITSSPFSTIPALVIVGLFCGKLGDKTRKIELTLNLSLLALLCSLFFGISIWFQQLFISDIRSNSIWVFSWSIHTIFSQAVLTSFLNPIFASWVFMNTKSTKKLKSGNYT